MKTGDTVVCRVAHSYCLTEGKDYVVEVYEPSMADTHFTWPAYVHVRDDRGRPIVAHASRFEEAAA